MKLRAFFKSVLLLVPCIFFGCCSPSDTPHDFEAVISQALEASNEIRRVSLPKLLSGLRSKVANTGEDSMLILLTQDVKKVDALYTTVLRSIDSCRSLNTQTTNIQKQRLKIDRLRILVHLQESGFVEVLKRWSKRPGTAEEALAQLMTWDGWFADLPRDLEASSWSLQMHLLENQVLVNSENVLNVLNRNIWSSRLSGLPNIMALVETSKNVYQLGETIKAHVFMSITYGIDIKSIMVDGKSLPLAGEHAVFEKIALEPGQHHHQVVIRSRRLKTGEIDEYTTDFDYYVLKEGE